MVRESYFLVRKVGIKVSTVKYMDEELVIRKGVDALIKELRACRIHSIY
jgi:hypothetical protein